jgi:hypothetical protein
MGRSSLVVGLLTCNNAEDIYVGVYTNICGDKLILVYVGQIGSVTLYFIW